MTELDALKLTAEASLRTLALTVIIAARTCDCNNELVQQFIDKQRAWHDAALDMVDADNLISEVFGE